MKNIIKQINEELRNSGKGEFAYMIKEE